MCAEPLRGYINTTRLVEELDLFHWDGQVYGKAVFDNKNIFSESPVLSNIDPAKETILHRIAG